MNFTFVGYEVTDTGIVFHFVNLAPGPGEVNDYYVTMTDAELTAVSTSAQLRSALTTKLQRKINRAGIASKLDPFIGQTVTI